MRIAGTAARVVLGDVRLLMHFKRLPIDVAINYISYRITIALTVAKALGIALVFLLTKGTQNCFGQTAGALLLGCALCSLHKLFPEMKACEIKC